MKIIAIIDNDAYNKKFLVELAIDELQKLTELEDSHFRQSNTKDIIGKEFDINSVINASKTIQALTVSNEYDSILTKQKSIVSALEKLQKPMITLKEQLKQIKATK